MKRTILLLSAIILLFAGCKKFDDIEASKLEIKNENIEKGWDYIKISGEYAYPVELESMTLLLSEKEDMSEAKSYECVLEGKTFSVEATDLKEGVTYFYCYEYDNGYGKEKGEKGDATTISKPIVVTEDATNVTTMSAMLKGSVTNNDAINRITARGFCWSTMPNPTIENDFVDNGSSSGTGTSTFTHSFINLTENTTYYYKAYATTDFGIIYGEEKSFKTVEITTPEVTTNNVINITTSSAKCGGNVISDGNGTITARGVCWSISQNPTIDDNEGITTDGSGTGSFISNIPNLAPNTQYYVRAYATNEKGTSYGEEKSFTTVEIIMPEVTTNNVINITTCSAKCGGNVISDGNGTITARGVCWSISQNPTIDDNEGITTDGSGTGSFTSNIPNLAPNTQYYVRAYATNEKGTSYGEELSFTTVEKLDNQIISVNGVSFTMIGVNGGTFQMGATSEQGSDAYDNEYPVHSVTLSDYYIGETEVTQELWEAVMGNNPSHFSGYPQRPVEKVSWNDCQEFITKLNELTGENFRLPTEAEWEYAARGGNESQGYKYSGNNTIVNVAWYTDNSSSRTHDVKTKCPNELGIYDMSGNVREWCQDWYGGYSSGSQTDPMGPSSGSYRVRRGGSWGSGAGVCRVSFRSFSSPGSRDSGLGLRLCLSQY